MKLLPDLPFLEVPRATVRLSNERKAPLLAAGVAFYVFTSLFPAIIAALSIFGLFLTPERVAGQSARLAELLPEEATTLVTGQLENLASVSESSLGVGAILAVLAALWGALAGIANLQTAVSTMFDPTSQRPFLANRALALGFLVGATLLLAVIVLVIGSGPWWREALGDRPGVRLFLSLARWVILAGALTVGMNLLFRFAPVSRPSDRPAKTGVAFATIGWLVSSIGFSIYVDNFGTYDKTYGALAGAVILLLWLWIGTWVILGGACLQAVLDQRKAPEHPAPSEMSRQTET